MEFRDVFVGLVAPVWVVRCVPGRDLVLANCCAAFELDAPESLGLSRLNEGEAHIFDVVFATREVRPDPGADRWVLRYDQEWDPGFPGYHAYGRRSVVPVRHYWDCHGGEMGKIVRRVTRCWDGAPDAVPHGFSVLLEGRRGPVRLPWGALSVSVGGVPVTE